MQPKRQYLGLSSTIPYAHESHPGFAKAVFGDKGILMSFQGLASLLRLSGIL